MMTLAHVFLIRRARKMAETGCAIFGIFKLNSLMGGRAKKGDMRAIRCLFAGAALMMATLVAPPAFAQTSEQIGWCDGTASATPDQQVTGCTAMIVSRQYGGDKLAIIFSRRGNGYLLKKEYDRAIEDYNQSIVHDISNADTFYNRGIAYTRKGDYDTAIADFNHAITGFDPARFPTYYKRDYFKARGNGYSGKGDFNRAVADYSEAIKLDPNFARAFYNRSVAKLKLGDTAGSNADLAQAKELQKDIGAEE
jgi:tetratricopeptide (TPR) repeat protein